MWIRNKELLWVVAGLMFAFFWASAATATKIGLLAAQPLVIAMVRFCVAASIMLFFSHVIKRYRLPKGQEWTAIAVYGLLNITIYLGLYIVAMQEVTAGIGALATATNPVFISLMSVFFLNRKLSPNMIASLIICMGGVVCAAWPLLGFDSVTTRGLLIMLLSMISYSMGALYISKKNLKNLSIITINAWQTLIGGIFLLPVCIYFYKSGQNNFNANFWTSVLWLGIPVSIFAAQLWLWLLKANPVKAGFWLFLCPLFGMLLAAWLMAEPISGYTLWGIILVVLGLLFARK